jgi:hypothetical protein
LRSEIQVPQFEIVHRAGCVVRFDDHFLGRPIPEELWVRLRGAGDPVLAQDGISRRHPDGTYRFVNVSDGTYALQVTSRTGTWTAWAAPPSLTLPLAQPLAPIVCALWPTPRAPRVPGVAMIRARLIGVGIAQLKVEMAGVPLTGPVVWSDRYNRSDSEGELVFLLPERLERTSAGDQIVQVRIEGGSRVVSGGKVLAGRTPIPFSADRFNLMPGGETRVMLNL